MVVRKKILSIVGTRPQLVKAAAFSKALSEQSVFLEEIVHTGQHYDYEMSEIFFQELKIPKPKYFLGVGGGSHGQNTGRMLEAIENSIVTEKPDAVLVYGDTDSTLAGALAASKLHIPVIHIEAGLRSFNKEMPEEVNRILTDHVSNYLFCPTTLSVKNLEREGITQGVWHVGDIMYDATLYAKKIVQGKSVIFNSLNLENTPFTFLTIHRAESTNDERILEQLLIFAKKIARDQEVKIVFPIHPRTKKVMDKINMDFSNFILSEPLGYLDTQVLLARSKFIMTDSGGLQKEAYFHRKPCITLRNETEWVETIEAGWNILWKDFEGEIFLSRREIDDYGKGNACEVILEILKEKMERIVGC